MKKDALAVVEPQETALASADLLEQYAGAGTENIGTVQPDQLKICQSTSKERKKTEQEYIPGLEEPNLFNRDTQEIYGDGPIEFLVVKSLPDTAMEFTPFELGGGVVDRNVSVEKKADGTYVDARLNWDNTKSGKAAQPTATLFKNYLLLLVNTVDSPKVVTLALKGSGHRFAKALDKALKSQLKTESGRVIMHPPAFARVFKMTATLDKKDGNTFSVLRLGQAGRASEALFKFAAGLYDEHEDKTVIIDVDNESHDAEEAPIPF